MRDRDPEIPEEILQFSQVAYGDGPLKANQDLNDAHCRVGFSSF